MDIAYFVENALSVGAKWTYEVLTMANERQVIALGGKKYQSSIARFL